MEHIQPKLSPFQTISSILKERKDALKKEDDETVDRLASIIYEIISRDRDELTFEQIIETLTKLGDAPTVLYDDNGYFAIGMMGTQNMPDKDKYETEETVFEGGWLLKPGAWKRTMREALYFYLSTWRE